MADPGLQQPICGHTETEGDCIECAWWHERKAAAQLCAAHEAIRELLAHPRHTRCAVWAHGTACDCGRQTALDKAAAAIKGGSDG